MNQPETTMITLTGELADWLAVEAERNTRTPSQHVMHLLGALKTNQECRKQATEERKAKRAALGLPVWQRKAAA
jgi:hypothetical protein